MPTFQGTPAKLSVSALPALPAPAEIYPIAGLEEYGSIVVLTVLLAIRCLMAAQYHSVHAVVEAWSTGPAESPVLFRNGRCKRFECAVRCQVATCASRRCSLLNAQPVVMRESPCMNQSLVLASITPFDSIETTTLRSHAPREFGRVRLGRRCGLGGCGARRRRGIQAVPSTPFEAAAPSRGRLA